MNDTNAMSTLAVRPDRTEAADYFFTYIDKVPDGDILATLDAQTSAFLELLNGVSDAQSLFRYAPGKWSLRESQSHVNDTERLFVSRAFWFARGFTSPLPGFDQDVAVQFSGADARPWRSHVDEFATVRAASMSLYHSLPAEAWTRSGIASDNPFTVRALAWITAGHVEHHIRLMRERYL